MSTKLHFRPYISDPILLCPAELGQDIDANDPVRLVNSVVDTLNLESLRELYRVRGRSGYHPRMMLKVLLYAYMNNVYSFSQDWAGLSSGYPLHLAGRIRKAWFRHDQLLSQSDEDRNQ